MRTCPSWIWVFEIIPIYLYCTVKSQPQYLDNQMCEQAGRLHKDAGIYELWENTRSIVFPSPPVPNESLQARRSMGYTVNPLAVS